MNRFARLAPVALAVALFVPGGASAKGPLFEGDESMVAPTFSFTPDSVDGDTVPGDLAIDFKDDVSEADMNAIAADVGAVLEKNSTWSHEHDKIETAHFLKGGLSSALAKLGSDPRIEHVEPMTTLHASFVPNDPLYEKQWHLVRAGAEKAWEYSCGRGVTVAVIDTGIACFDKGPFAKGSDLSGTRCVMGYDFVNDRDEASDDHGHGTHVAGTIAQTTHNGKGVAGLAHCARLMPVKVLSANGSGTVADVASGIRFAADNGAQVINMSLGGRIKSAILEDAVKHAASKGVIIVAAAGNSRGPVEWPAAYPDVLAISATDEKDKLAWFSSRGPQVAVAAPGVNVTQQTVCQGGQNKCEQFGTFSGTSMAAPHVAGAAALLVGAGVSEPSAVKAALQASAHPMGDANKFGAGILDAASAVARAHWTHVGLRLFALTMLGWFVSRRVRKLGGKVEWSKGTIFGALLGGVGLFALAPFLHVAGHLGSFRFLHELLMRPFGEWDLLVNASFHRYLPLANAVPAVVLSALFFGSKRLRPFVGGFALGSAALLTQLAWSADVATPFGSTMLRVWTIANMVLCVFIARLALDRKTS